METLLVFILQLVGFILIALFLAIIFGLAGYFVLCWVYELGSDIHVKRKLKAEHYDLRTENFYDD